MPALSLLSTVCAGPGGDSQEPGLLAAVHPSTFELELLAHSGFSTTAARSHGQAGFLGLTQNAGLRLPGARRWFWQKWRLLRGLKGGGCLALPRHTDGRAVLVTGGAIDDLLSLSCRRPAASVLPGSLAPHFSSLLRPKPSGYAAAMPVDTLSPGAPAAPALPCRLRTKVPGYLLRRPADGGVRKPSAVERLEADKAKYVKSLHVANTRQEPVQPLLSKQPLFSPETRRTVLTPSRRALPGPCRRPQLDLDILSSLINLCDSPVSPAEASRTPGLAERASQPPQPPPTTAAQYLCGPPSGRPPSACLSCPALSVTGSCCRLQPSPATGFAAL
ncbi:Protein FAM110A [Plecturocebus cupreus]